MERLLLLGPLALVDVGAQPQLHTGGGSSGRRRVAPHGRADLQRGRRRHNNRRHVRGKRPHFPGETSDFPEIDRGSPAGARAAAAAEEVEREGRQGQEEEEKGGGGCGWRAPPGEERPRSKANPQTAAAGRE